jgi:hypothetical protein
VVVHPDDDERGVRRDLRQGRERAQAGAAQDGLLDDDDGRRQPLEQPDQVRQIGGRGQRLDSGLDLEQPPERGAHTLVARGDEDRHLLCLWLGGELREHLPKHRPPAPAPHRGAGLRRRQ